jgi:hypothetical protein
VAKENWSSQFWETPPSHEEWHDRHRTNIRIKYNKINELNNPLRPSAVLDTVRPNSNNAAIAPETP